MNSPEVLHCTYISECVDPTFDSDTPIVHEDCEICNGLQKRSFLLHVLKQNVVRRSELHTRRVQLLLHTPRMHARGLEVHVEVSGQFHAPAVLFHGTEPQYSLNIRLVGPQIGSGCCSENRRIPCSYRDSKAGSSTR